MASSIIHRHLPHCTSPINLLLHLISMQSIDNAKTFARRDRLIKIERKVQTWWEEGDVFKSESKEAPPAPGEKFFANFPYPYINGYLHLGHIFSLSKLEFATAYHRLWGANVLLPFTFHCTGMLIKASVDKLAREIERFGYPPRFLEEEVEVETQPEEASVMKDEPEKFKSKKSKSKSWDDERKM